MDSSVAVSVIVNQNVVNAEKDEILVQGLEDENMYVKSVEASDVEKIVN